MAFTRGKFGIEYNQARQYGNDSPRLLPRVIILALLAALISLAITIRNRLRVRAADRQTAALAAAQTQMPRVREPVAASQVQPAAKPNEQLPPAPKALAQSDDTRRPARVRHLLMRLEAAEKARDWEMAASTIEQIRALPGSPAADLDDPLARRLGTLNTRRMFSSGTSPWTKSITVKRGENASRIAREHGSTLAALEKLNAGNLNPLRIGTTLRVLDHPRFSLAVHRVPRTADLSLNGKFFKRYYLASPVTGKVGLAETPERLRPLLKELGITFKPADRAELELLLPPGTPIQIGDY